MNTAMVLCSAWNKQTKKNNQIFNSFHLCNESSIKIKRKEEETFILYYWCHKCTDRIDGYSLACNCLPAPKGSTCVRCLSLSQLDMTAKTDMRRWRRRKMRVHFCADGTSHLYITHKTLPVRESFWVLLFNFFLHAHVRIMYCLWFWSIYL